MSITFKGRDFETTVDTVPKLNLLGHAQLEEIFTGSECGGHGVCGRDRVRIPKDEWKNFSPPTEIEKQHLAESEISAGIRLTCQCFPNSKEISATIYLQTSPEF